MKKSTLFLLLVYPTFIMAGYMFLETILIQNSQRSFDIPPVFFLMAIQVLSQGSTLVLMYRSLVYKSQKSYRTLLGIMTLVCILLDILAIQMIIPFELYRIFPYLITYYGSAFVYSVWSHRKEEKKLFH